MLFSSGELTLISFSKRKDFPTFLFPKKQALTCLSSALRLIRLLNACLLNVNNPGFFSLIEFVKKT